MASIQRSAFLGLIVMVFQLPAQLLSLIFSPSGGHKEGQRKLSPLAENGKKRVSAAWLTKSDIRSRLLHGDLAWHDEAGKMGGKAHYRRHLLHYHALYRVMQSLISELERIHSQNHFLTPGQQRLYNDLAADLPAVEAQLEELGGEG